MKKLQKMLLSMFLCLSIVFTIPLVLPETAAIRTVHAATQIRLNKTQATLISGQTTTLKVSGTTQKVTWTSSNKVIATVSANGVVSAKKKGTAIITAKVGSKKYTCKITVETPVISKTAVSIIAGDRYTLKVTGTTQKITWTTGNTSIATVSKNGLVIGKKKGVTVITAKVGTKKYTCKVTVESPTISKTAVTITEGNKITLKLNGTTQKVTWTSGNTSIASSTASLSYSLVVYISTHSQFLTAIKLLSVVLCKSLRISFIACSALIAVIVPTYPFFT